MSTIKVLVIDDDATQRLLVKEYLEAAGYVVRLAEDGRRGLQLAATTRPQVILLDLMLPAIDGYSVCTSLKSSPETSEIPVILITGSREGNVVERGLAAGAADFIIKPVDWDYLADRVGHVLRQSAETARIAAEKRQLEERLGSAADPAAPARPGQVRADEASASAEASLGRQLEAANARIRELTAQVDQKGADATAASEEQVRQQLARQEAEWTERLRAAVQEVSAKCEDRIRELQRSAETAAQERAAAVEQEVLDRVKAVQEGAEVEVRAVWDLAARATQDNARSLNALQSRLAGLRPLLGEHPRGEQALAELMHADRLASTLTDAAWNLRILALCGSDALRANDVPIDLEAMLAQLVGQASACGRRRDVTVTHHCQPGVRIAADPQLVELALLNLVDNALKFSPPGGTIDIDAGIMGDGCIAVQVKDGGGGIAQASLDRLHALLQEPGQRIAAAERMGGYGILLTKAIASLHAGTLSLDSEAGKGTVATLKLPGSRRLDRRQEAPRKLRLTA